MANKLLSGLAVNTNWTKTENGADAHKTTGTAMLDLFGTAGALRNTDEGEIAAMFSNAYYENPALATKLAFYTRNCRGGLGERRTAKTFYRWMAENATEIMAQNLWNVPFYGTWLDLYALDGTRLEKDAYAVLKMQFEKDLADLKEDKPISLLGKWLPSENASSKKTRQLARKTMRYFELAPREYRKSLSALRAKIDVVEAKMSKKEWQEIDYAVVPSIAAKNYRHAFQNHDPEGYGNYIGKVEKGEAKINASVLYPYDLVHQYANQKGTYSWDRYERRVTADRTIEAQWAALPDYVAEADKDGTKNHNMLVVADTSGSMTMGSGTFYPIDAAVGLAIYFAQRNHGEFAHKYLTFSQNPSFIDLGNSPKLCDAYNHIDWANWGGNTDIDAVFNLLLDTATADNVPQEDMPSSIIIISDMQFDSCVNMDCDDKHHKDYQTIWTERFAESGYKLPRIVYWNVNGPHTFHATKNDDLVQFISGASASSFKELITGQSLTAEELMLQALNDPMYDRVVTD